LLPRSVSVTGEVGMPGPYPLVGKVERLSDVLARAGGTRESAYVPGIRVYRNGELISTDVREALADRDSPANLPLVDGDSIHVPRFDPTIRIPGAVMVEGWVAYEPGRNRDYYIQQAGRGTRAATRDSRATARKRDLCSRAGGGAADRDELGRRADENRRCREHDRYPHLCRTAVEVDRDARRFRGSSRAGRRAPAAAGAPQAVRHPPGPGARNPTAPGGTHATAASCYDPSGARQRGRAGDSLPCHRWTERHCRRGAPAGRDAEPARDERVRRRCESRRRLRTTARDPDDRARRARAGPTARRAAADRHDATAAVAGRVLCGAGDRARDRWLRDHRPAAPQPPAASGPGHRHARRCRDGARATRRDPVQRPAGGRLRSAARH